MLVYFAIAMILCAIAFFILMAEDEKRRNKKKNHLSWEEMLEIHNNNPWVINATDIMIEEYDYCVICGADRNSQCITSCDGTDGRLL